MQFTITPSALKGSGSVPSSKSHTMRAILFAALAHGTSTIHNILPSPDTKAMIEACSALGAGISQNGSTLFVEGTGGALQPPEGVIDVGNSGQVLRFVGALAALMPYHTVLTGDHSICTLRPMAPLLEGLNQAGAFAVSSKGNGYAPIIVRGPARAASLSVDGQDSQPISALLMLAAFLNGQSRIAVRNPGEKPWIGLTLYWFDRLGIPYTNRDFEEYTVSGPNRLEAFTYTVPADWSSAAFPIVAALITRSTIVLEHMDFDDPQGDKAVLDALEQMGARFILDRDAQKLHILPHQGLHGAKLNVNAYIDAVPVLAAAACYASSPTTIQGAAIARQKESDRLHATAQELGKLGARIEELPDGLIIHPSPLHGSTTNSLHDHRIAMAAAVAALGAKGKSVVQDTACVAKSFPGFAAIMAGLGAHLREI